jgi:hypothetical protein
MGICIVCPCTLRKRIGCGNAFVGGRNEGALAGKGIDNITAAGVGIGRARCPGIYGGLPPGGTAVGGLREELAAGEESGIIV